MILAYSSEVEERKPKIIAIVGPTASGKTSLGIYLAKKLKGEIISADSRQVYTGLDIGTGKVTKKEMAGIPHHLIDVVSPKKQFTVDDFVKIAKTRCFSILQNTKMPIVVGGTGLYVDALLGRVTFPNVPPNETLRKRLEKKSAEQLFAILKAKDPERAKTIERHNKRRLIRALEIATAVRSKKNAAGASAARRREDRENLSARKFSSPEELLFAKPFYEILWLGLNPGKEKLRKNIRERLHARMRQGMVAEARRLHAQGLSYKRMRELGLEYRYLADYLQDQLTKEVMSEKLERAINHYAKRQMRWFKRNKDIHWVNNRSDALKLSKAFLKR